MAENSHEDRNGSFEARLARYGLTSDGMKSETLRVSGRSTVRLSGQGGGIPPARWLRPSDLSQMKEWIGVPQAAVSKNAGKFVGRRAGKLPPANLHAAVTKANSDDHAHDRKCDGCRGADAGLKQHSRLIRGLIRQYVYGDASELAAWQDLIERHVRFEFPFWLFNRVVVERDGVLEIGPGLNTLITDTLIIEHGGEIRCIGSLKVNCRRIARS